MSEDEFRTDLRWPTDPLGERELRPHARDADGEGLPEARTSDARPPATAGADRSSRFVVEAYDRLADRILERLQALRVDLDSNLAEIRSEVATLRQAVDDVGDRVQLRQLRSSIEELQGDVNGLHRSVLQSTELEQVSADVAALRADLADLRAAPGDPSAPGAPGDPAALGSIVADLRVVADSLRADDTTAGALTALRDEVASLRRRIALRAGSSSPLSDDEIDRLADVLVERGLIHIDRGR